MNTQTANTALDQITYGFYILTAKKDAEELKTMDKDWFSAGVVSWAMQSSFDPQMVTLALKRTNNLNETVQKTRQFALHVLGKDEKALIEQFADDTEKNGQRLNGVKFEESAAGNPILNCGIAVLECKVKQVIESEGDHNLIIAEVVRQEITKDDAQPLTEWQANSHYGG